MKKEPAPWPSGVRWVAVSVQIARRSFTDLALGLATTTASASASTSPSARSFDRLQRMKARAMPRAARAVRELEIGIAGRVRARGQ
jgi:pyruvate/2-oxoglutarate dehydrogenase complex dihydrolipoamide acyltransferase (E2) component